MTLSVRAAVLVLMAMMGLSYATAQTPAPSGATSPASAVATAPAPPLANWGAIAFTADGSFATSWKKPSKSEAEADVAVRCAKFGRGACEIGAFSGDVCIGLATYLGTHSGRRWKLSYTGGATTSSGAQQKALDRCNDDRKTRKRCQLRTVMCADGR